VHLGQELIDAPPALCLLLLGLLHLLAQLGDLRRGRVDRRRGVERDTGRSPIVLGDRQPGARSCWASRYCGELIRSISSRTWATSADAGMIFAAWSTAALA
jgi:hypothetical protein